MILRVKGSLRVSFKVYKDKKGLGACDIQNEDETPLECVPRPANQTGKKRKRGGGGKKKPAKKAKTKEELMEEREVDEDENTYIGKKKPAKKAKTKEELMEEREVDE